MLGGAIGVAIASTVAAAHLKTLLADGVATRAALTGSLHWGLWVCAATGLLALRTIALIQRRSATASRTRQLAGVLEGEGVN